MTELFVGVDIGGTKTAGVLCDRRGVIRRQSWVEHDTRTGGVIVDHVLDAVRGLIVAGDGVVVACGVAVAGLVSIDRRHVVHAANLGESHVPLADAVANATGVRTILVNDANATLAAHLAGDVSVGVDRTIVLLTLGTGLGGAVAVTGRVIEGAHGFAGELGHMTVDFADERRCLCGAPGCVENYASGRGVVSLAAAAGILPAGAASPSLSPRVLALTGHDPRARNVVEHAGTMLGRALTQLCTVVDPDEIVIGGGFGHAAAPILLPAAAAEMRARWPFPAYRQQPPLRLDPTGAYAAAAGAALTARRDHDSLERS